jgi:glutamine amidotransferase
MGSEPKAAIVDYGAGNLASIANMLKKIGIGAVVTSDPAVLERAERIILPGVGAFDTGMRTLRSLGLVEVLDRLVREHKKPLLGLCLGMQLITRGSEEGVLPGFGWLAARTVRFAFPAGTPQLKVPHVGWNRLLPRATSRLLAGMQDEVRAYFVHSYYLACDDETSIVALTRYGHDFPSIVHAANVVGMQFHPEKSHKYGMRLLKNFFSL